MAEGIGFTPPDERVFHEELLPALRRLDAVLERAVQQAQQVYGAESAVDRFRGLYISNEQAERSLRRAPGEPLLWPTPPAPDAATAAPARRFPRWRRGRRQQQAPQPAPDPTATGETRALATQGGEKPARLPATTGSPGPQFAQLQQAFDLTGFDLDVVLLALAPELDRRYGQLYAYLQDDVSRRRPSVDLALNLLCATAAEKISQRARFSPQAPLVRHRLLHILSDRDEESAPLLARYLKLDGQIVRFLLRQRTLDSRLAPFCDLLPPGDAPGNGPQAEDLAQMVRSARDAGRPLRVYIRALDAGQARQAAHMAAAQAGALLLRVDLREAPALCGAPEELPYVIMREAWVHDAVLLIEGMDVLAGEEQTRARECLLRALAAGQGVGLMDGAQPWRPAANTITGVVALELDPPDAVERHALWEASLAATGASAPADLLDRTARRFRLTPTQIAEASMAAAKRARLHAAPDPETGLVEVAEADLLAAARAQTGHDLATLAQKIEPVYRWDDIILPDDSKAQLREIVQRVDHQHTVLHDWGFAETHSRGRGVNALFSGASGTGKTMAAEILARELGLDLYRIDLSGVVSKYIGETEKNLDRIFRAAEHANAILFFDEADALFGKRSEVRDSHDRYANIEISYLLQKMEEHDGITILATNLRQNLDDAFMRRLTCTVHFPYPDAASRLRIWQGVWPQSDLLAADVDFEYLAETFPLSGGNIKNIAVAAAYLAAAEDSPVTMRHLFAALRREYQKLGKSIAPEEIDEHLEKVRTQTSEPI